MGVQDSSFGSSIPSRSVFAITSTYTYLYMSPVSDLFFHPSLGHLHIQTFFWKGGSLHSDMVVSFPRNMSWATNEGAQMDIGAVIGGRRETHHKEGGVMGMQPSYRSRDAGAVFAMVGSTREKKKSQADLYHLYPLM